MKLLTAVGMSVISCAAIANDATFEKSETESNSQEASNSAVSSTAVSEQEWGIAAMSRVANIPFVLETGDKSVNTFIPMMFFENDYVFIDGIEGGVFLYKEESDPLELSGLVRMRFVDIPASEQNSYEGDTADFGLRARYHFDPTWYGDFELMTDSNVNWHANWRVTKDYDFGDLELSPTANLRYKSSDFNSTYYALIITPEGCELVQVLMPALVLMLSIMWFLTFIF